MQWLDMLFWTAAVAQAVVAGWTCSRLASLARRSLSRARRVAALSIALAALAVGLEAVLFVWLGPRPSQLASLRLAAVALLRGLFLASTLLLAALLARSRRR